MKLAQRIMWHSLAAAALAGIGLSGSLQAADINKGRELYTRYCVGCHGPKGTGQMPGAPNFSQGNSLMKSDSALVDILRKGSKAMPGFSGMMTEEQAYDVVAYVRTMR